MGLETIPPMLLTSFRWLAAGASLLLLLKARGERMPHRREWPSLALLGILMMSVGNGGVVWAEQSVPSGLTAVLGAGGSVWVVGIGRVIERPQQSPGSRRVLRF